MEIHDHMNSPKRIVIALYNMGGPAHQEEVEPFLRALFNDPDLLDIPLGSILQGFVANKIIKKRLEEVKARYQLMGGGSPQLPITENVARKLKHMLLNHPSTQSLLTSANNPHSAAPFELVDVLPLFRYCEPRAATVLQTCSANKVDELWLLSQYPHCARATTGTSLREIALEQASSEAFATTRIRAFSSYGDEPDFLDLWTARVRQSWNALPAGRRHLVISAHNLPLSYVAEGDPYPQQIRRTAQEVTRRLSLHEGTDWSLCWQSAVGPVRWMSPTTEHTIERLCAEGNEHLLVWPVAFVSDHIETLVEIDLEYSEFAMAKGAKSFSRVKNLDDDEDFIQYLTHLVHRGADDLQRRKKTPLLRDFTEQPAGPFCSSQPAGCLCANYFLSGRDGLLRGKSYTKIDSSTRPRKSPEGAQLKTKAQ